MKCQGGRKGWDTSIGAKRGARKREAIKGENTENPLRRKIASNKTKFNSRLLGSCY